MKYKYDAKSDTLLIKLSNEKPDFGEQRENIITHYNKKGKPVEIEILDASKTALDMIKAMLPKKVV
ncbi:MAG: DUF2283 domain-containing protein [Bacteroidota bacterium]